MSEVKFVLRTADQTRKAEISLARSTVGADVIQAAVQNWAMPLETDYTLVNTATGKSILPNQALVEGIVEDGHILEVQPVLVAGVGLK